MKNIFYLKLIFRDVFKQIKTILNFIRIIDFNEKMTLIQHQNHSF